MDIGALIVGPIKLDQLRGLFEALAETCSDYDADPAEVKVAFSAHKDLGDRLVVHLHEGTVDTLHDPLVLFADLEEKDSFGASLSGQLADVLEASEAPTVVTCLFEAQTKTWTIYDGVFYGTELTDEGKDQGPLRRLAQRLEVADLDMLKAKLSEPDTAWIPVRTTRFDGLADELSLRMG